MEMPEKKFHIACGQLVCTVGDVAGNLDQIEMLSAQAAAAGARLILFGEAAITGYAYIEEVTRKALRADGPEAVRLAAIAKELEIAIAAGTLERSDEGLHVSHFVVFPVFPGSEMIVQRKHALTPSEKEAGILPGPEARTMFEVDGVKMAVCICADSGIPDINQKLAAQGCQVYLGPSAGGEGREFIFNMQDLEDEAKRALYLQKMEQVCFVGGGIEASLRHHMARVATNLAGDDGIDHYHPGHSSIIDGRGNLVALLPGQYIKEFLSPQMIHGEIVVRRSRTAQTPAMPVS